MAEEEVVDAQVVDPDETPPESPPKPVQAATSTEVAVVARPQGSTALIEAKTAGEKREIAAEIATTLDDVIKQQGLRTKMGRRKKVHADGSEEWVDSFHVNVEGWQTLATFLDLAVVPVWTRQVRDPESGAPRRVTFPVKQTRTKGQGQNRVVTTEEYLVDGFDWEARVEVYKDGALIAGAEAMVSRSEDSWKTRDDHALRSMAQTRATGKAIAGAARWIVALAGYSATPAEEMVTPQGDEPELNFGPLVENGQRALVFEAVRELVAAHPEPAGAETELAEAAKAAAGQIGALFGGKLPKLVGDALLALANHHTMREAAVVERQAQDQAAEQPDDTPAAGTVFIEGEDASGVREPRFVKREAAVRMCQCPEGFDVAESDDGKRSDVCPMRNHGIPF